MQERLQPQQESRALPGFLLPILHSGLWVSSWQLEHSNTPLLDSARIAGQLLFDSDLKSRLNALDLEST